MAPRIALLVIGLGVGSLLSGCGNPDEVPAAENVATYNSADPADVARQKVLPSGVAGMGGGGASTMPSTGAKPRIGGVKATAPKAPPPGP